VQKAQHSLKLRNAITAARDGADYAALDNLMVTDKFAPSDRRNAWEIMSAPTQVGGCQGWGH